MSKKQSYRKLTRMIIAFVCCFPIFLVVSALMKDANSFLVVLINLVIGGTIMFVTYIIGDKKDEKREYLHQKHLNEIEERKRQQRYLRKYSEENSFDKEQSNDESKEELEKNDNEK